MSAPLRPWRVLAWVWVGLALGTACGPRPPAEESPPEVMLEGVRYAFYEGSERAATGRAARLVFQRSSGDFVADQAQGRLHPSPGTQQKLGGVVDVRADRFRGNLGTRQSTAEGNVEVRTDGGFVGQSERAHYDGAAARLVGDRPVTLRGPGYALAADGGFLFELEREQFDFTGPVRTVMGPGARVSGGAP